ncbi:MAG: murein biosynthesis integral membrane protein MurJ [Bdellovibrionales bacterium]|nr:murein biosynthesis integral membrane protein MurJ [Bdellovibrionales bacterium]
MSIAVFLSRILGLVREQVFAALFGASNATDAYQIAFRIPNLLRDLFAEGAMSAALVPTFIKVQKDKGEARAWQVATRVFVVLFAIVSVIAIVGMLCADSLVGMYASAYKEIPGKFELTVRMTRIMMPFFPLVALAAGFMAILNACGKFFVPSFASAMFNLVSIVVGVTMAHFSASFGLEPIEGMAYGVIAGGFVQALIQWPILRGVGFKAAWLEPEHAGVFQDPALKRMMWLMIPGTFGLAATQINILVNSIFATSVGSGAVSWLNYAFRLMQFPIGIFGVSLASATLPVFSRSWTEGSYEEASQSLLKSCKRVFAINLPASTGLAFLGVPIIGLIFQHGHFNAQDTLNTAHALAAYAIGLTAYSVVKVLVPICYAIGETRLAVISSFFSVCSNLTFNLLFVKSLGFIGLAFGTSITALLNSMLLWWMISRKFKKMGTTAHTGAMLGAFVKYAVVALAMGFLVYFVDLWVTPALEAKMAHVIEMSLRVLIGLVGGVCSYLLFSSWLKCQESLEFIDLFRRRLLKK